MSAQNDQDRLRDEKEPRYFAEYLYLTRAQLFSTLAAVFAGAAGVTAVTTIPMASSVASACALEAMKDVSADITRRNPSAPAVNVFQRGLTKEEGVLLHTSYNECMDRSRFLFLFLKPN